MKYILFDQNGKAIQYAPKVKTLKNGAIMFGFNTDPKMLQEYGYIPYDGNRSLAGISLVDGKIVEKQIEQSKRTIFSKLEIRRAMRALQCEDILNNLLKQDEEFAYDWQDATEIDIEDEMFKKVVSRGIINSDLIDKIIKTIG